MGGLRLKAQGRVVGEEARVIDRHWGTGNLLCGAQDFKLCDISDKKPQEDCQQGSGMSVH